MLKFYTCIFGIAFLSLTFSPQAVADYTVTCESKNNHHKRCKLGNHGYITMTRQLSRSSCIQGKTWDWDRKSIWVDDGCRAEFNVASSEHEDHHSSAGEAAGVILGAALLGALASNSSHDDKHKYNDENYYGSRHSSYVPKWMVGTFEGYNPTYGADITITIKSNGRVKADIGNRTIKGYINDERLHVGSTVFDVDRIRHGFVTSQIGDRHNEVRYRKVR